jgi:microsomal epoxide hydrolase
MADYSKLPSDTKLDLTPFKSHIPDSKLQKLRQLIELSPIAPPTFENLREDGQYGVTRDWLMTAQKYWSTGYNW